MIILGIDPALGKTGWGAIRKDGSRLSYLGSGLFKTSSKTPLPQRLAFLHQSLADILKEWHPDSVAVEETYVNTNPQDALKLGQARGVLLSVPALYGIDTAEYAANRVKKTIVGVGHATKDQVGMMVKTLLPTCGQPTEDEADALAVAMTHAHYGTINKRILEAVS